MCLYIWLETADLAYRRKTAPDQTRPERVPGIRKTDKRPKTTAPEGLRYAEEDDPFPEKPDGEGAVDGEEESPEKVDDAREETEEQ